MADDTATDAIVFGTLLVGGGLAGYLGGRWFVGRRATPVVVPAVRPVAAIPAAAAEPARPEAIPSPLPAAEPGPVTTPDPSPRGDAPKAPHGSLPRVFDPVFAQHRGEIPIEYLRALAMRESGMKAGAKGRAAWGLLQVTETVRRHYNKTNGTAYARERLLEPAINVAIATWLLRIIIDSYQRRAQDVPNLRADWSNPRFVELLAYGWNAGWSSAKGGGVGSVVDWLQTKGARDIDIDLVHEHARGAGASVHLRNPAKVSWCKGVAALYLRERSLSAEPVSIPTT